MALEESENTPFVYTFKHMWRRRAAKGCVCAAIITIITSFAIIPFQSQEQRNWEDWGNWCLPAGPKSSVRDFEWVSVQHLAPRCFQEEAYEGSRGWTGMDPNPHPSDPVGYGCWFVVTEDTTHSVRVNTRRVLSVENRSQAAAALNITCSSTTNCAGYADDFLWCQQAMALGYDSIQTVFAHPPPSFVHWNVLVLCYEGCMKQRLHDSGCVPVETRNARHQVCSCNPATKVLSCSNDQILGCGNGCT